MFKKKDLCSWMGAASNEWEKLVETGVCLFQNLHTPVSIRIHIQETRRYIILVSQRCCEDDYQSFVLGGPLHDHRTRLFNFFLITRLLIYLTLALDSSFARQLWSNRKKKSDLHKMRKFYQSSVICVFDVGLLTGMCWMWVKKICHCVNLCATDEMIEQITWGQNIFLQWLVKVTS